MWVRAGDVQEALAGCGRALELDPDSVELQSMRKELEASAVPADWDALRERAAARCAPQTPPPHPLSLGYCCKNASFPGEDVIPSTADVVPT